MITRRHRDKEVPALQSEEDPAAVAKPDRVQRSARVRLARHNLEKLGVGAVGEDPEHAAVETPARTSRTRSPTSMRRR